MAETIKSALFVDYDSIHRSLKAQSRQAAERFAQRSSTWIAAIESGRLVKGGATARRRMMIRRCYADPQLLGKNRLAFVAGGFEVIDCPPLEGQERNSADIHIALDAMDALDHPSGYDEFVLLSADTDLSPVVTRLRTHDRTAIVYVNAGTPANYREIADGLVDEAPLIAILAAEEAPLAADGARAAAPAAGSASRADIEVLARKVHGATNVPLFSPKTFADLFRLLAAEISETGYHFQNTAENVAAKLVAAGRNVSRRQVVFVVKGLALKGHVFSTTDTPEKLAEVFREQVLYLVGNAGLTLDEGEVAFLPGWISGASTAPQAAEPEPAKPVADEPPRPSRRRPAKPAPAAREAAPPAPAAPPPARVTPPPVVAAKPPAAPAPVAAAKPAPKTVEDIRTAAAARLAAAKAAVATPPKATPAPPAKTPPTAPTRLAAIAAKAPSPAARPAQAARPSPPPAAKPAPAARPQAASEANKEALESSILAAIAQAVDVLVEDGNGAEPSPQEPAEASAAPAESQPEPEPSEGGDSDDIGDEIQRIIASYSRARQNGERG
jgi:uncharacterized LabA/DUF88 family protein